MTEQPISLAQALNILKNKLSLKVQTEIIPVSQACGRISAENVNANLQVPRYPNAAVDGYGFQIENIPKNKNIITLTINGEAKAGHPNNNNITPQETIRVFTGAPVNPKFINTIIMQENVKTNDKQISFSPKNIKQGQNIRNPGDDVNVNDNLLKKGEKINPAHIGLLAAQAIQKISVFKKLNVGLISTGDELCDYQNDILNEDSIYDSNRPMLYQLLKIHNYNVTDYGIVKDNPKQLLEILKNNKSQVIITSASISNSREDHLRKIIKTYGTLHFANIKCKPGRPAGFGSVNSIPIIALPGNPVAAFTIYTMLARPALRQLSGENYQPTRSFIVQLDENFTKKAKRTEFIRASLTIDDNQTGYIAKRYGKKGAAILSSIAAADGFIKFEENDENPKKGQTAKFIPMNELLA